MGSITWVPELVLKPQVALSGQTELAPEILIVLRVQYPWILLLDSAVCFETALELDAPRM
jgi:hypothetical protein